MRTPFYEGCPFEIGLRRPDSKYHLILEALAVTRSAVKQTQTQWKAADSLTGFDFFSDGTVKLAGGTGIVTLIENTTSNSSQSALGSTPGILDVVRIELAGTESTQISLTSFRAHLDPGGGAPVKQWELRLYTPVWDQQRATTVLRQMIDNYVVPAPGVAGDVTWDLVALQLPTRIKSWGAEATPVVINDGIPRVYAVIRGLDANGVPVAGGSWSTDTTKPSVTTGGNIISGRRLIDSGLYGDAGAWTSVSDGIGPAGTPRCRFQYVQTVTTATITFSGGGNKLDLGSVPTNDVELFAWSDTPGGSSVLYEIRNPVGPGAWTPFKDGDTILGIGLPLRQTYDVRVTETPGGGGVTSPVLHAVGLRERTSTPLFGLVGDHDVSWGADPVECRGEITQGRFVVIRDGDPDYLDQITQLFTGTNAGDIELRLWVGCLLKKDGTLVSDPTDPTVQASMVLPRIGTPGASWFLIDSFRLEDWTNVGAGIEVQAVSPADLLRKAVPVFSDTLNKRVPLEYTNQTQKAVWDDLMTGQIGMLARHVGPGIETTDSTLNVTKTIGDSDGKDLLNELAYIGGGVVAPSQGRLKFADLYGKKQVVCILPPEEIAWGQVTPGLSQRVPEVFMQFGWRNDEERFDGEYHAVDAQALTKLGVARLDPPDISAEICKWLPTTGGLGTAASPWTSTLADTLSKRHVNFLGQGLITADFNTNYPMVELEIGDLVAVPTDRFIGRNIKTGIGVSGPVWLIGVIVHVGDAWHRSFRIWVRSIEDIVSGNEATQLLGFAQPEVLDINLQGDHSGDGAITGTARIANGKAVYVATSNGGYPNRATTLAGTLIAAGSDGIVDLGALASLINGQNLYVSVIATELADGSGAVSELLATDFTYRKAVVIKTITLNYADFRTVDLGGDAYETTDAGGGLAGGYGRAAATGQCIADANLIVPIGAEITSWDMTLWVSGTSNVSLDLREGSGSASSSIAVANNNSGGAAWVTTGSGLGATVDPGDNYFFRLRCDPDTAKDNARFAKVEVTYQVHSTDETY